MIPNNNQTEQPILDAWREYIWSNPSDYHLIIAASPLQHESIMAMMPQHVTFRFLPMEEALGDWRCFRRDTRLSCVFDLQDDTTAAELCTRIQFPHSSSFLYSNGRRYVPSSTH